MDWLDDTDINHFLKVFVDTTEDAVMVGHQKKIPDKIKTVVCSSFYFESLRVRGMDCISRWLEHLDLEKVQNIIFPLHSDSHWSLCLIHPSTSICFVFDPLRPVHLSLSNVLLSHSSVKIVVYSESCTQQTNGYDCGVYALYYAGCILKNKYEKIHKPILRKFKKYIRRNMKNETQKAN
ncbi:hypothetical protein NEMIN01_0527 [Nematocida minor]|uniref:uncharacterized protein n=1 Tax=Nematocida minor TaxID=1912983 RepID=UPI00221FAE86|nr:uncharacterized protein NEMIN01_0527 [Nematocida minor]KAI5189464.1 hypothetical protein NEMIN01_0527 [Nematocida minor]